MPDGLRSATGSSANAELFEEFFEGWVVRQEHFLDELLSAKQHSHESRDDDLRDLVNRVLAHYQQYYEEKSRLVQADVFLVFSPPWFNSFERSLLWVAGFKPGLAFRVLNDSVHDLSEEQGQSVRRLKGETKVEERMLNDELARIQESVGAPPVLGLARKRGREVIEGEKQAEEEMVLETLRTALESVVGSADFLRTNTVAKVAQILNPAQNVEFMTAGTQLQLRIRSCGLARDRQRRETTGLGPDKDDCGVGK